MITLYSQSHSRFAERGHTMQEEINAVMTPEDCKLLLMYYGSNAIIDIDVARRFLLVHLDNPSSGQRETRLSSLDFESRIGFYSQLRRQYLRFNREMGSVIVYSFRRTAGKLYVGVDLKEEILKGSNSPAPRNYF